MAAATLNATDTKTLAFNRLHGIDDSSSSPDGQSANAGSLSYTATIGGISKTISRSDVGENSSAGVAAAMAEAFRKDAPVASMSGAGHLLASTSITLSAGQQSTLTNNGRLSLTHNSVSYLLTNTSDGVVITGGHKDAVSLSYNDSTKTISTQIPYADAAPGAGRWAMENPRPLGLISCTPKIAILVAAG